MWHSSANALIWQVPIDHNKDVQYQRGMLQTETVSLCQLIIWSMSAIFRDSLAVVLTRPRAIPLANLWVSFSFLYY